MIKNGILKFQLVFRFTDNADFAEDFLSWTFEWPLFLQTACNVGAAQRRGTPRVAFGWHKPRE